MGRVVHAIIGLRLALRFSAGMWSCGVLVPGHANHVGKVSGNYLQSIDIHLGIASLRIHGRGNISLLQDEGESEQEAVLMT